MATVTTGNWQKSLWPGIDNWYNKAYDEWPEEYSDLFTTRKSDRQFEQTVGQSLLGRASIKPQGQPLQYDDTQQTYVNQYDMSVRALGTIITLEAYRYNQYSLDALSRRPKALAHSMRETKEVAGANVLNNGFDTAFTMGSDSDGVPLFSASHPSGPYGDNRSNLAESLDGGNPNLADTGDATGDGQLKLDDLLLLQKHLLKIATMDSSAISRSDQNANSTIELADLLVLQKLLSSQ